MGVSFIDLKRQYELIKEEIDMAIKDTIDKCAFVAGEKVKEFEDRFAGYCGCKHAVGISTGTSALYVALKALGIGKHDAVITVPYTFIASAEAITLTGATPIFVDIDEDSYNISPQKIEEYIKEECEWDEKKKLLRDKERRLNVRAIMPVHLYGQMADMDRIMEIAETYKLLVLEDAAQAHGATYKEKKAGTIGNIGAFSFYPTKNLGAYGQAGLATTNNDEFAEKMRMLIDHGQKKKYQHEFEGGNFKMAGFQAAILNVKLDYLDDWNEDRRQNAHYYNELLADLAEIRRPKETRGCKHIYHLYVVRVKKRNQFQQFLKEKGVDTLIHYPLPLHLQPAYKHLGYKVGDFAVAERCAEEVISLPMFPELTKQEIEYVCEKIREWVNLNVG